MGTAEQAASLLLVFFHCSPPHEWRATFSFNLVSPWNTDLGVNDTIGIQTLA